MIINYDLLANRDYYVRPHFKISEFMCPCCNKVVLDSALVEKLEQLRAIFNKPIIVTSGYRCKNYNKKVGGYYRSRHLKGDAADVKVLYVDYSDYVKAAIEIFPRVGVYHEKFIHVDLYKRSRNRFWIRNKSGIYTYTNDYDVVMAEVQKIEMV